MHTASTIDSRHIDVDFVFLNINANIKRTIEDAKKNVSIDMA